MVCAYLLNDSNPPYFFMALNSLKTLRHFNRDIPVKLFLIEDSGSSNRLLPWPYHVTKSTFLRKCDQYNVEVIKKQPIRFPGDENFLLMQRAYLAELADDTVLYLDADTFFFGDITKVIKDNLEHDVLGCENYDIPTCYINSKSVSINGGVVLWNNGLIRKWCEKLPYYSSAIKAGKYDHASPLLRQKILLREEASIGIFALENNLKYKYFEKTECLLSNLKYRYPVIFHSITANFPKAYELLEPMTKGMQPPATVIPCHSFRSEVHLDRP